MSYHSNYSERYFPVRLGNLVLNFDFLDEILGVTIEIKLLIEQYFPMVPVYCTVQGSSNF